MNSIVPRFGLRAWGSEVSTQSDLYLGIGFDTDEEVLAYHPFGSEGVLTDTVLFSLKGRELKATLTQTGDDDVADVTGVLRARPLDSLWQQLREMFPSIVGPDIDSAAIQTPVPMAIIIKQIGRAMVNQGWISPIEALGK